MNKIKITEEKINLYLDMRKVFKLSDEIAYRYMASTDNKYGVAPLELLETLEGRIKFVLLTREISITKGVIKLCRLD